MSNGGIQIPVGVKMTGNEVTDVASKLEDRLKKLVDAVGAANKIKYDPFDPKTLQHLAAIEAKLASIAKLQQSLGRGGGIPIAPSGFLPPPTPGAPGLAPQPTLPALPAPGGGAPAHTQNHNQYRSHAWSRTMWGQPMHAGLNAAGPYGSAVSNAISTGAHASAQGGGLTGMRVGVMSLIGNLAGTAIGQLVGSIREKIGAGQQEYIGYDTLKRTLGDVNVGFNVLKEQLRDASNGLGMTFAEGQKLGQQFAKLSGMSGEQYKSLGEEVKFSGGMSRSFGVDPSQGNAFMAQMRMFHVTSNVEDSRRLGLVIGETIAKSGAFSKADEVLEAIAGFTGQQTRMGMNAANVSAYAGMYSGMIKSGIPGMDPGSAAALLGRANSVFSSGGGAGEAGENFIYRTLGSGLGLDPIQASILREQGLFGTGAGTFGKGSTWERFASQYHVDTPGKAAGSSATNLQMVMEQLQRQYSGRPEMMVNAMSRLFGVNNSQAMALSTISPQSMGGLAQRLQRLGININDVNATGISRLAQLDAHGGTDAQIKQAATQNQEDTEGSKTRATINGVENAIQTAASSMIPLLNSMRDGILYMAGAKNGTSPREMAEAVLRADSKDKVSQINEQYDQLREHANNRFDAARGQFEHAQDTYNRNSPNMTPAQRAAAQKTLAGLRAEEETALKHVGELQDERVKKLKEEGDALDKSVQALRLQQQGAGAGRGSINDTGDRSDLPSGAGGGAGSLSYRNNNPGNIKYNSASAAWLGATGQDKDGYAMFPSAEAGRAAQEKLLFQGANYRNLPLSQAIPRWAPDGKHNDAYVKNLLSAVGGHDKRMSEYTAAERAAILDAQQRQEGWSSGDGHSTPLPEHARVRMPLADQMRHEIAGTFMLQWPNGQPAAAPVQVATRFNSPNPRF